VDPGALQSLSRTARRTPLWIPDAAAVYPSFDRDAIKQLIPHREPFLLLDEVTEVDLAEQAVRGRRRVLHDDPVFEGHFPGRPIYPGVLQLEIIGQLGLCLLHCLARGVTQITTDTRPRDARAVRVHGAQFIAPVEPGDHLTLVCRALEVDDFTGICAGQVIRGETICAFGFMEVYFVDA